MVKRTKVSVLGTSDPQLTFPTIRNIALRAMRHCYGDSKSNSSSKLIHNITFKYKYKFILFNYVSQSIKKIISLTIFYL